MARVNAQYLSASVINLDCRPRCGALDKLHWTRCTGRLHWVQACTTVWNWDCNSADAVVWYCDIQGYTAHCTGVIKIKRWRVSAACGCKWLHTGVEPRSEGRRSDTWNTWWGLRLAMMIGMMTIAIVMRVTPRKPFFFCNITTPLDLVPYKKVSIFENQSCMVLLELHEFWCSFTREAKPLNKRGVGQVKMVGFLNLAQLACFGQLALGGDSWGNYSVRDDSPPKLYTLTCRSLPSCTNHILHNFQMIFMIIRIHKIVTLDRMQWKSKIDQFPDPTLLWQKNWIKTSIPFLCLIKI